MSSTAPPGISPLFRKPPRKVNDSVYEVHSPVGNPSMQVLFFHGLFFEESQEGGWWSTWESGDKSCIWPEAWLVEDFPHAQIFFVSYDGVVSKSSQSPDMYIIAENLISDLIGGDVGQIPHCPLTMVGHSVGGIVMKQLCVQAKKQESIISPQWEIERNKLHNFLGNVSGMFYYDTPHHGTQVLDRVNVRYNPLLAYFQTLSKEGERLNFEFNQLRRSYAKWRIYGLGASCPPNSGLFKGVLIVKEGSGREGDFFNIMAVDHYAICKPSNKGARSFYALKQFLNNVASDNEVTHLCHGLPKYLVGLEKPVYEIQVKLTQVKILGIIGMGGVGKTTLAKRVFNNISRDFEYTCFANNVKGFKIHKLEDWLLTHFHQNGRQMNSVGWSHLKDKKMLIVMDDVDLESQLQLIPNLDHFGNDSHLIITTRNRGILDIYEKYDIHDLAFLDPEDAKTLFFKHLFGSDDIGGNAHKQVEENVNRVVEKCQGLPLTLEVMGCYLRRHVNDARFWDETIEKLGHAQAIQGGQNDRVWASLQLSYDALSPEEKEMFIDAATVFLGADVNETFCIWSKMYTNAQSTWENLLNTSMVKVVFKEGYEEYKYSRSIWLHESISVHEQLRDLAITRGNGNSIFANRQRQCDQIIDLLHAREVKVEARSLCIWYPGDPDEDQKILRLDSLKELQTLKYLTLENVLWKQPRLFHRKNPFKAKKKSFPQNLFVLYWTNPLIKNRPHPLLPISLEENRNLVTLLLRNWRISKDPFGSLGKLVNLVTLALDSVGLERLPENFGDLSSLKWLSLKYLALSILPDSFGNLSALEWLVLCDLKISELPNSFGNLSALDWLALWNLDISELPESFGNLSSLRQLTIHNCKLTSWPDSFGRLESLELLRVTQCESLKTLPNNFSQLPRLQQLHCTSFDDAVLGSLGWVRDNGNWACSVYRRERPQADSAPVPLT